MSGQNVTDKKRRLREVDHLTVPPRLEGRVKNAMMYSTPKKKKSETKYSSVAVKHRVKSEELTA